MAEVLKEKTAVEALNTVLLPAMKEVGDKFGSGELILPFVLQSAEVMKRAVSYVEQFLDKDTSASKGTVVLATVYGDVHDIGKNLVRTILSNNGYTVHDLGKQVPVSAIIAKAQRKWFRASKKPHHRGQRPSRRRAPASRRDTRRGFAPSRRAASRAR